MKTIGNVFIGTFDDLVERKVTGKIYLGGLTINCTGTFVENKMIGLTLHSPVQLENGKYIELNKTITDRVETLGTLKNLKIYWN